MQGSACRSRFVDSQKMCAFNFECVLCKASDGQPRNLMVARCMILCLILGLLRVPFILEQPASSLTQYHPLFEYVCKKLDIFRVTRLQVVSGLELGELLRV